MRKPWAWVMILLSAGAILAEGAGTTSAQTKKIIIATGVDATFAHYVIAAKKGFLEKYGIQAEIKAFDDGSVALDTLLTGQGDVGGTSELGGLARRARGGKLYVAASGAQTATVIGLVGKNSIKNPKDLEGKTIGFPKATGAHYFFARYVKKHGVDETKLKIKNLQAPEGPAALNRGDVDALFLWEPWMSRIVASVPNMAILARCGDDDVYNMNVYIYFSQKMIDDQELGANTLKAFIEASEWMKNHVDEAAEITAQVYKTTPAESKAVMGGYTYNIRYPAAIKTNFEEAAQFLKNNGVINSSPDMTGFLRPELMKRADPARVQ